MAGAPEEQRLVAEAGIGHSREYIRFWPPELARTSLAATSLAPEFLLAEIRPYRCLTRSQRRVLSPLSAYAVSKPLPQST